VWLCKISLYARDQPAQVIGVKVEVAAGVLVELRLLERVLEGLAGDAETVLPNIWMRRR
jgi:hypothetical protein